MAVQKEKATENEVIAPKQVEEPKYTIDELAAASGRFGVRPECVVAAMRFNGLSESSLTEAKKIVEAFMKREVE